MRREVLGNVRESRVSAMTTPGGRAAYSSRFVQAFVDVLREHSAVGPASTKFADAQSDERVPVEIAHQALVAAVEATQDPDLGLKAARRLNLGDAGAIDYLVSSAATLRDAISAAGRYSRLINDLLDVRLELEDPLAVVRLDNSFTLPRAAIDFQVGGFFRNHVCHWFPERLSEVTVSFMHTQPDNVEEYHRTFAPAAVRFAAPYVGFSFDRRSLDRRIAGADANLYDVMLPYAEHTLGTLGAVKSVTADVAGAIVSQLASGQPDIGRVASQLGMSVRTLARRLEDEGTTFRDTLDSVRHRLALDYVRKDSLGVSEIAEQLGFSHAAAFHRAFRRWTNQTPLQYRKREERGAAGLALELVLPARSRRRS
jgi:AraC-like DNA-binding protein